MSLKDFQVIAKLGEGAYSSVYKVKRIADSQEYALKKVKLTNLSDKEKQNALNEVRILASVRCPNIVTYKEVFLDGPGNSLCIIMEYVNYGDLYQKIVECQQKGQLIPENEIWSVLIQVTKGLKALHDLKIFHRDLKSANVFLNKDGSVKLGDMNVSKIAKKGLLYTQTGTPYYASPEVWKDQPYDQKSDIWSLGCVLYEMTTLKPPFRAEDMEGLYKKVIRGYYSKIPSSYSQDLNNVIRALLQVAPHLRPSCDKILQLPSLIKRMDDKLLIEADEGMPNLLQTIRIPKNIHYLTERLPKPNYSPLKLKKLDKVKFIQTLGVQGSNQQQQYQSDGSMLVDDGLDQIKDQNSPQDIISNKLPRIHKRSNQNNNIVSQNIQIDNTLSKNDIGNDTSTEIIINKQRNISHVYNDEKLRKQNGSNLAGNSPNSNINLKNDQILLKDISQSIDNDRSNIGISQINQQSNQKISTSQHAIQQQLNTKFAILNENIYGSIVKKVVKKQSKNNNHNNNEDNYGKSNSQKPARYAKNIMGLLDIEGESKPLLMKIKKNNGSIANIKDDSEIDHQDAYNKLPSINNSIITKQQQQQKLQQLSNIVQKSGTKSKDDEQQIVDITNKKKVKKQNLELIDSQSAKNLLPEIGLALRNNKQRNHHYDVM